MAKISAVVLTKNEEKVLANCLDSIAWCNEIILIDDYSTDKTTDIAHTYSAKVYKHHLDNNFAAQRNYGLERAKNKWVLFVDADETVSISLQEKIKKVVQNTSVNGFKIRRIDRWLGKELKNGEWGKSYLLRLARKDKGRWERKVHEYWDVDGIIALIDVPIYHEPHQSISEFIDHINRYSKIHAEENLKEGKNSSLFKIVLFPPAKFIVNFIIKAGYKDGIHGFIYSIMLGFHSFLGWIRLWLRNRN